MSVGLGDLLDDLARDRTPERGLFTTTINLVTYCHDAQACEVVSQHAREIGEKHSCRVIFLNASRGSDLRHIARGKSENIEIGVEDMDGETIRSVARALCVPNVRTSLFWSGHKTFFDERFTALARDAQSVIVDSSRLETGAGPLRELARVARGSGDLQLRDLSYMRLLPWQDMVAQFFDDPTLAVDLSQIESVDVCAGSDAESYYVLGWLASRLGWQPLGEDTFANPSGARVRTTHEREGKARRIRRIALQTKDSHYRAELTDDLDLACMSVEGKAKRQPRCSPLHDVTADILIERAMFLAGNDPIFYDSLAMAASVLDWHQP